MTSPTEITTCVCGQSNCPFFAVCHCGCGGETRIAEKTDRKWRYVRGLPIRFCRGHQCRQMREQSKIVEVDGCKYRTIPLTRGQVAIVDIEDYEKLSAHPWYAVKGKQGQTFYAARTTEENGRKQCLQMHVEVCRALPGFVVDHIDRNGLHNWRTNLRAVTHAQNLWNTKRVKTNTSGFTGAHWHVPSGRWISRIKINGRAVYLGSYETKKEAAAAYSAGKCLRDELFRPSVRR